uniref:Uncharacterized protein n=2 Tax=Araneus ventricosus TaxID=182803 RepID=A0A4Y2BDF5_ARAVE|nr:hypothetical protein AVEN_52417-1 [Araneus ventricosus]
MYFQNDNIDNSRIMSDFFAEDERDSLPHNPDDAEELEDICVLEVGCELLQGQVDVEGEGGREVDDVDGPLRELQLAGAGDKADRDLEGEPGVAGALDEEEGVVRVGTHFVQGPGDRVGGGVQHSHVADHRHAHVGVRLQAEGQDGHADEEHRHHPDDLQQQKCTHCHFALLQ